MIAYKGFNKDLTCTRGKGTYQYEIGKKYVEDKAQCASTGFHCCEEPIEVLTWYPQIEARYCMVEAGGDIHEDGTNKISCTEMTIIKEISLELLGGLECKWIMNHPECKTSRHVHEKEWKAKEGEIAIVRGKNPKAAGALGSTIYLLKEAKGSSDIEEVGVFQIDGEEYKPDTFYLVDGSEA